MRVAISGWSIRNPIPVVLLFIALTIAGLIAYTLLPIKQFPNIIFPVVQVTVTQSGAAPSEMETQVTRQIEDAIAGVANVRHISSNVVLGASTTSIEFELSTDLQKSTDDVRTAVERARVLLPPSIDPPRVAQLDIGDAPILTYAVSAPGMSGAELSWFVDNTVARAIQAEKGVAQVVRVGGFEREINVTLDSGRMRARGVTAPQINDALRAFNTDETGGLSDIGGREQTVRVLGQAQTVDQIRDLTIPTAAGYVRLSDVAEVGDGQSELRGFARLDGRPAVAFQVNKTRLSSEVSVERAVLKAVAELAADHKDVAFTQVISTVTDTRESYEATLHVLLEGMGLAALVVLLFLRDWRSTIIAAVAMPLSLLPALAVIWLAGFSLNFITLLALTLVIGILIDDAIVEIENIEKRVQHGATPYRAALVGADAIGLAVVATTASIVVVFLPVSFITGISGQFFKEFGITVAVAVLFSLAVARLLTPLLAAYFLKASPHPHEPKPLPPAYKRVLDWALDHKWLSALVGAVVFFGAVGIATTLPTGLTPVADEGYVYLTIQGPPGATRSDMELATDRVTRLIEAQPDVERVFIQIGSGGGSGRPGSGGGADLRTGTATVVLKKHRSMTTEQFKQTMRPQLRTIPDVRINTQAGGFGATDTEVVLASQDPVALDKAQLELQREMRTLPQLTDIRPSPPPPGPELVVRPKPAEAARLGVNSQALAQVLRVATIGDIDANVAKFSEGERRIPIRVRLPESARDDLDSIGQLLVPVGGKLTTLDTVADISFQAGPGQIVRYDRERRVSVLTSLHNATFGEALKAIDNLPVMKHLPAGVHLARQGDAESMAELFGGILGAMGAGIALIYAVLVLLFGSFFKPVTILSALPLSLMGTFLALLLTRMQIDLPVLIGMLMLLGLAAKNSILLVEFAIEAERRGASRRDALYEACRERARPIIMTTVAMAAGMVPTALGLGEGSSFRQPMAIAVIGGLVTSTALSLVLVPVVYEFIDIFEQWISPKLGKLVTKRKPGDDRPLEEGEDSMLDEPAPPHQGLRGAAE